MATGSMNVSNNSKINNEIKALQDKDKELEITLNTINSTLPTKATYIDIKENDNTVTSFEVKNLTRGIFLVTLTNLYVNADIYWIGILQFYSTNIYSIKKIVANSYMDNATVGFDGTNISISGGIGINIQYAKAIRLGY